MRTKGIDSIMDRRSMYMFGNSTISVGMYRSGNLN